MPRQFSTLYTSAMKYSQGFGQAGKGLFVLSAIPKAHETFELCTMDNAEAEACSRSAVRNGVSVTTAYGLGFLTTYATTMLLVTTPVGWGVAAGLVIGGVVYGSEASDSFGSFAEWLVFDALGESDR